MPALAEPRHRHLCRLAAEHLLRAREQGYPAAIRAGSITTEAAERGIHLARCLVAQWHWIDDPAGPPCPPFTEAGEHFGARNFELADNIQRAAIRQRLIANRAPADHAASELADLYEALAWLQEPYRGKSGVAWIVLRVDVERSATAATLPRAA